MKSQDQTQPGPEPKRKLPPEDWEHRRLYERVRDAIAALPAYFRTETYISGVMATDLHTLNTVLGATIEDQVVGTLNTIRKTWDPDEAYSLYSFVRQPQTFPDVLLRNASNGEIILGIELKGWYLLAKEGEPSLRFQVTPKACAIQDLVAVVPWVLGNVISGSPILFEPFVESARYAADYRNHHWQHVRVAQTDTEITTPESATPYPSKSDKILDKPVSDSGGNFGRLARTGIMNAYIERMNHLPICGIKTIFWRQFLKAFQEKTSDEKARKTIERLRKQIQNTTKLPSGNALSALSIIAEVEKLLGLAEE